jgi:hypothetical protein
MKERADDIPSYVAELFAAERQAPRPSAEVERRVRGKVAITLAATAAGTATLGASSAAAATAGVSVKATGLALGIKLSVVAVSVGVVGAAGGIAWRQHVAARPSPAAVTRPVASHRGAAPLRPSVSPLPEVTAPVAEAPVPAESPQPAPTTAKSAARPARATEVAARDEGNDRGNLALESPLIDQSRRSIETHYPAQALARLAEHQRKFPHGQLEEEREALWVQALVASGNADSARAHAAEFRRRFPRSIQLPVVEAALLPIE